jgi:hypothetical protein
MYGKTLSPGDTVESEPICRDGLCSATTATLYLRIPRLRMREHRTSSCLRNPNSQTAEAHSNVRIAGTKIHISGTNSSIDLNFSLWNDLRSERRAIRNLQFMHGFCTDASRFEWMLLV